MRHPFGRLLPGFFLLLAGFPGAPGAAADELRLKNGDQITGTIEGMDEESVQIRTDYGLLTIRRRYILAGRFGTAPQDAPWEEGDSGSNTGSETGSEAFLPQDTGASADPDAPGRPAFPEDILLHLPFDGQTGDAAGTFQPVSRGGLEYGPGRGGKEEGAILSDGKGSYLEIPPGETLNGLQSFTLAFWFQGEMPAAARFLLSKWQKTSGKKADGKFSLSLSENGIYCYLTDKEGHYHTLGAQAPGLDSGAWHHLALTHRKGKAVLYLDGEILADKQFPFEELKNDTAPLQLLTARAGSSGNWSRFNFPGKMDDFVLYRRPLSPEEVARAAGKGEP